MVNGASRLIGDTFVNKLQITTLNAPITSAGNTYGPGANGTVLKSNGTSTYWGTSIEYIRGTWTTASGTWTGVSTDSALYEGKQIILYMPYAGSGNATLNLTLANGTSTGAKNVYFESTTRFTTHKDAYSQLHLIYHENHNINGTNYTGWWYIANRDTNNGQYYVRPNKVKAQTAVTSKHVIGGTASGYNKIDAGTAFDIQYDVLWANSDITAGSTTTDNYVCHYAVNIQNSSNSNISFTSYKNVYIKGTISGTTFTPISGGNPYVQDITATEDGYVYYYIGRAYSSTAMSFNSTAHDIYVYKSGHIQRYMPEASKTTSGIVTTDSQDFVGRKGFGYLNRYGYNDAGTAVRWIGDTYLFNNAGTMVGEYWYDSGDATNISSGQFGWKQLSPQSTPDTTTTGYCERYYLPTVTSGLTEDKAYAILTSKNTITISQGGTGATTAAGARGNLAVPYMVTETYPALLPTDGSNNYIKIGTANDSYGLLPSQAGGAGSGHNYLGTSYWYWKYAYIDEIYGHLNGTATSVAIPVSFGTAGMNGPVLQYNASNPKYGIWYNDASVDTMRFSASGNADTNAGADLCINGNGAGTVTIRGNTILTTGNYNSYALPLSGGVMTGNLTAPLYLCDAGSWQKIELIHADSASSQAAGWYRTCVVSARHNYADFFLSLTGGWNNGAPTVALLHITMRNGEANIAILHNGFTGRIGQVRLVKNATNTAYLDLYLNATSGSTSQLSGSFFGNVTVSEVANTNTVTTSTANVLDTVNLNTYNFQLNGTGFFTKVYGAVWNDYAEYRKDNPNENQESGRCVKELGDGSLALTTKRLERGCEIVSDTFGFAIGQDEENGYNTPIASNGRVLAYPYESIEEFASHIGWPVCSGPNGTVSIMTEEEEEKYPSRIIGTISEIPDYEEWGTGKVKVDRRIWIRIR